MGCGWREAGCILLSGLLEEQGLSCVSYRKKGIYFSEKRGAVCDSTWILEHLGVLEGMSGKTKENGTRQGAGWVGRSAEAEWGKTSDPKLVRMCAHTIMH